MRSLATLLNKAKKLYAKVVEGQGVTAKFGVVCGLLSCLPTLWRCFIALSTNFMMVRSAGLLVLRDVGRDPVDDVFLLPARELWDTIEDLTHLSGWYVVTLAGFLLAVGWSLTTCSRPDAGAWFNYPFLTQKERDNETGLDYFLARYYSSTQGRFTSVDPLLASAKRRNPQTWNRYSYGLNNPLRYTDPDGEAAVDENAEVRRTTTTTEVIVQDQDRRGNVTQQAKVTITETKIEGLDSFDPITVTTAEAVNTGNGARDYSEDQLRTMANVGQNVVEVSRAKQFDPTIALGIANTETRLGTAPPGESAAHKQPNINPMQLSGTSGTTATTNLRSNIAGSIGIFNANSASTNTLNQRLQDYNREPIKVEYANKAERQINQIRQSQKTERKMIRFSIF